ncbi:NAD(P)-dependent dehydrogenase (short-subunit alcohol dehydrogenase family) [Pseudidiomarina tainanensis]|uniref:NAD(P)-dependent dehydrogenase (Short-subunit alcohol dehydrogenase family) n=3 Tax=Pseudidiomarina TaxID=2800384 RepID=A0A368V810_9GAMM|nr:NAD(P)-dependent dehydrogenase (short-subunit alcohol dehydrogenase family) [Pseudidiomarina maritima]RBP93354.1 NAD(P)-dependent dehydrogenase (short-subunit alcohol dehydrogenase family) [Pseudidiomarina tainanensis]RCW35814.1 NAD(P)-dependent dehydrogenase (short-subunit alcohol dehydrogenase family) [Pseudidiomarina tainanensis]
MTAMHNYSFNKDTLAGKTILVTGAGDGIGRTAAKTFASCGATVILLGRTVKKLEAVYDEIVAAGGPEPAIVPLDLKGATKTHYQGLNATIVEQFGKLDGLLHNAGVLGVLSPFEHIDHDSWNEIMQINVTAQFMLTKALMPALKRAAQPSIVFTSSGVGRQGRAFWGPYAVSKFATEGLAQVMADEYEGTHVRVNVINPGATRTTMRSKAYPAEDASKLKTAEQLMPTYVYFMADDSIGITNQSVNAQ